MALGHALAGYGARFDAAAARATDELLAFCADRLKVFLRERGVRHDLVSAVFALAAEDDLVRLLARVEALKGLLDTEDGVNLLAAYRRASNIVAIEERKDGQAVAGEPEAGLLREPAEQVLYDALEVARGRIEPALAAEDFAAAMAALAALRQPVDRFFDGVLVNAAEPELRGNRLRMLGRIRGNLQRVADFTLVEDGA